MKLLRSNGRELTIRECGPVIYRLRAPGFYAPLPLADRVMEDEEAREYIRALIERGIYRKMESSDV